jgi:hypothetical protein
VRVHHCPRASCPRPPTAHYAHDSSRGRTAGIVDTPLCEHTPHRGRPASVVVADRKKHLRKRIGRAEERIGRIICDEETEVTRGHRVGKSRDSRTGVAGFSRQGVAVWGCGQVPFVPRNLPGRAARELAHSGGADPRSSIDVRSGSGSSCAGASATSALGGEIDAGGPRQHGLDGEEGQVRTQSITAARPLGGRYRSSSPRSSSCRRSSRARWACLRA